MTADDYEVRMQPRAVRAFRRLPVTASERIQSAIDALERNPRPPGATKLVGQDDYRIRVGDYRIIYGVDDSARQVFVVWIAHRREVYRR